ncbi:MAG: penicillin-binding transpeptidase domain-containing protein [Gracilimonas sp.]|nr:penicillin-binding transpeptidase domain-containing protein [Gracilimonas sp.]
MILILRDHDPLGDLTFEEVIQKSSNVATAEIAMRMKPEVFYQYARNMGFGIETNIDLIGEVQGSLAKPYEWSLVTLPWMSHGYEIQTTPLQIAQAYSAFANNGMMMRPYLVERIEDNNGSVVMDHEPVEIRRIAKKSTLKRLMPIFESVVADSGTGDLAQVEGLRIAGKTGTAKKVVNGRYTNNYRGSFVGFFPADDPQYVAFILLDEPRTSGYGGFTAAPIFKNIALRIAGLDNNIQRTMTNSENDSPLAVRAPYLKGLTNEEAKILLKELNIQYEFNGKSGYVADQMPEAGTELNAGDKISLTLSETFVETEGETVKEGYAEIPDLRGMNMRKATNLLSDLGLKTEIIGSGTVFAQYPRTGEWLRKGYTVTIRGKARSLETLTEVSKR